MALALDLAEGASAIHRARLQSELLVDTKSSDSDFVSNVDREAEAMIAARLLEARPHDGLLAEEGALGDGTSGVRWIIDPLDGTTNFIRGYPSFGCSIAVEVDGRPLLGVVSDSLRKAAYAGTIGHGATYAGRPISLRTPPGSLARALVSTGFSYDAEQRRLQGVVMAQIVEQIADIRRSGSAALDLCRLAAGSVDAYFELDLAPWDYAAGSIIAAAAGAQVLQVPGAHGQGPAVVAAHPRLLPALVELLHAAGALTD
jgi:Archaeal fructose-1,6-bisphosphatase and related enzymes of inositol monophosphatase family